MSPDDAWGDEDDDDFDEFDEEYDGDDEWEENDDDDYEEEIEDDVYDDAAEATDAFEQDYAAGDYGGDGPEWWTDDMPGDWFDLYDDSYEVEEFEIAIDY